MDLNVISSADTKNHLDHPTNPLFQEFGSCSMSEKSLDVPSDCDSNSYNSDDDIDDSVSECSEGQDYALNTNIQISRSGQKWFRYCSTKRQVSLETASAHDFHRYFSWLTKLKYGKNGRRLRGFRQASSFKQEWKNFRLFFEQEVGRKIDPRTNRQMHKIIRRLVKEKGYSVQTRDKILMPVDDLALTSLTALKTTKKRFVIGRQRILCCLFLQLAGFTLNRPEALLNLRYRHIMVTLLKDPGGSFPRVLLEFTFEFTKEYLGMKEANTFAIPEIIYDPTLILSPHAFLLGTLFGDDAFLAPSLTKAEQLTKLKIGDQQKQLPIPLKPEMANLFLFCDVKVVDGVPHLIRDKPMSTAVIRGWLKFMGEILGFRHVLHCYTLRYNGAMTLDESEDVTDAQRNLIMIHASSTTFLKHYLSRRIGVDSMSIIRGRKPQTQLMKAATRISRWMDLRRPYALTDEQKLGIKEHPEYKKAQEKVLRRKGRFTGPISHHVGTQEHRRYHAARRALTNTRSRLERAELKRIREHFDDQQAVADIELQLSGCAIDTNVRKVLAEKEDLPLEQINLISKLTTYPQSLSLELEWQRRSQAIEAIRMYCHFPEGGPRRGRKPRELQINAISTPLDANQQSPRSVLNVTEIPGYLSHVEQNGTTDTTTWSDTFAPIIQGRLIATSVVYK